MGTHLFVGYIRAQSRLIVISNRPCGIRVYQNVIVADMTHAPLSLGGGLGGVGSANPATKFDMLIHPTPALPASEEGQDSP